MSGVEWVAFVIACMCGAVLRYLLDDVLGTRAINVTGSLLLGVIVGLAMYHGLDDTPRVIAGTGFCGAYTTFSAFSLETVRMMEGRTPARAVRYSLSTLLLCVAAAAAGLALMAI